MTEICEYLYRKLYNWDLLAERSLVAMFENRWYVLVIEDHISVWETMEVKTLLWYFRVATRCNVYLVGISELCLLMQQSFGWDAFWNFLIK